MTDSAVFNILSHLGVAGIVAAVLGWLLLRSEKRVGELLDTLVELTRSGVKTDEQTIAAINANTSATREQAAETRALKSSIDMLLAERGRRGR